MAGRPSGFLDAPQIKIAAGAIALMALFALLSSGMRETVKPSPTPEPPGADFERLTGRPHPGFQPAAAADHIEAVVRASGGDWNKLAPEDQRYVNNLTAGHGAMYLRDRAKSLQKEAAEKAAKAASPDPQGYGVALSGALIPKKARTEVARACRL